MLRFAADFPPVPALAPKVLIVEDDASILKALARLLTMSSYEVLCGPSMAGPNRRTVLTGSG